MYNNNNNYNINNILQDARAKLDAEFQERQRQINNDYQNKMNDIVGQLRNYGQPQQYNNPQQQNNPHQQLTPVNSEIQNAFMRSEEYQKNFNSAFNQFLMQNFFHQFQQSPFYVELKKYADSAYPTFEKNYIDAAAKASKTQEKPTKNDKNESN